MDFVHYIWFLYAVITFVFLVTLVKKTTSFFKKRKVTSKDIFHDIILAKSKLPLTLLSITLFSYFGIHMLAYGVEDSTTLKIREHLLPNILVLKNITVTVLISWYLLRVIIGIKDHLQLEKQNINVGIISKILQFLLIISSFLIIVDQLGLNISGILTFGGIGGIAISFAAKDLLANFFGSLVVALDRPFAVGDRILSPDKQISGVVKKIGWRVTKILTYEKRPIYIPNSLFTTIIIQNDSRMSHRRIDDTIRIRFKNIATIDVIIKDIDDMLRQNPRIDNTQTILVSVSSIGSKIFALNIYAFIKTTDWTVYREIRQDILLTIAKIIDKEGATLVFPESIIEVHEKEMYQAISDTKLL